MTSRPNGLVLIGLLALACASENRVEIPDGVYEANDPAVRAQIESQERRVRSLENADAPDADLAFAVGELGKLYHALQLLDTHAFGALNAAERCYREARRLDPSDHRWPYLMAFAAQNQGNLDAAASSYRTALEREPEMLPALHRLAETEVGRGRPDEAVALWTRALEVRPDFASALYGLGTLELARGEAGTAVDLLERALAAEPGAGRGHYSLGMAYRNLGDEERAATHLERASHTAFPLDDPLVRELAYLPVGSAALVQQGLIAVQAGEFAAAASLFGRAVDADPTNMEARKQLALAHIDAGQFDQAQAAYEELLALDPAQAPAHFELGQLHASRGRPVDAIRHLTTATRLAPDYKQAHYQLALLLERTGQAAEALRSYDRVLALDPAYAEAATRRATALAAAGRPAEGLLILEARVAEAPSDATSLHALSVVLRQQGRLPEALTALERGLAAGPFAPADEARLRTELGGIFAIQGRLRPALNHLQAAQRLDPTQAETSFLLGMVQADLGRAEEAGRSLATALAARPDLTPARVRLAVLLAQTDRCSEAQELLEDGRRVTPNDPALAQALSQLRNACAPR
ncbi:MAG: tetratricopeptide repeat protein [Acidobacteria bacterium]|nr:tetratricopeptide repeat protein [Acidobacteriota bacterium]